MGDVRPPMVNTLKLGNTYVFFLLSIATSFFIQFNINAASTCIRVVTSSANQNKL